VLFSPVDRSLTWNSRLLSACPLGYTGRNGSACDSCQPGSFKPSSGPQTCSLCSIGTYSLAIAAVSELVCQKCPSNMNTAGLGQWQLSACKCDRGYQRSLSGDACVACPPGMFKSNISDLDCIRCQPGKYSDSIASIQCSDCPADTFGGSQGMSSEAQCNPCAKNSHSPKASSKAEDCVCNKGSSGPDAGPCLACARGSYKNVTGSEPCTMCATNTYSDTYAAESDTRCLSCPNNSLSLRGSGDILQCLCSPGYYGPNGGPCNHCMPGSYKAENGSAACSLCMQGTYSGDSAQVSVDSCRQCPNYTSSVGGSRAVNDCTCIPGYTGPNGQECMPCSSGSYKAVNGSSDCLLCQQGTHSRAVGANSEATCEACPSNSNSGEGSITPINCTCNRGYTGQHGQNCTACVSGKYKTLTGSSKCTPCAQGKYSSVVAAIVESNCEGCPAHSNAPLGSRNISNCTCNRGYTGNNGDTCTACIAGTFKPTNGSEACTPCGEGSYSSLIAQVSQNTCVHCPNHTFSPEGSQKIVDCTCNAGYTGADGQICTACIGGYKNQTGSSACIPCEAGKYALREAANSSRFCYRCKANRCMCACVCEYEHARCLCISCSVCVCVFAE
jgi:hypothetical protein